MKYILNKLPGNEKISEKLGNTEQQNAILELYSNCKIVFSYAREDWAFVEKVAGALKLYFPQNNTFQVDNGQNRKYKSNVFCYTDKGVPHEWIRKEVEESIDIYNNKNRVAANACYNQILENANVFVVFTYQNKVKVGPQGIAGAGNWQTSEITNWNKINADKPRFQFKIDLGRAHDTLNRDEHWQNMNQSDFCEYTCISANAYDLSSALKVAEKIIRKLLFNQSPGSFLPTSSVFSYEKDAVQLYQEMPLIIQDWLHNSTNQDLSSLMLKLLAYLSHGIPPFWPSVARQSDFRQITENPLTKDTTNDIGSPRVGLDMLWLIDAHENTERALGPRQPDMVVAAALSKYHRQQNCITCMLTDGLSFPEAGPRKHIYSTPANKVAIVVSGGIAPGINAVIDGIVKRHKKYNDNVKILGINNGFYTLSHWNKEFVEELLPKDTSARVTEGGSCLQTCRQVELLPSSENQVTQVNNIVSTLIDESIKILYVIGGDGSMRAAHQIAQACRSKEKEQETDDEFKISVVGIPKTMDNDILWVWQTFGFATAVEKAREIIDHLATEVKANPRICVLQLFGSASGFVVSHAVLASRTGTCDFALIPEADFSIDTLAWKMAIRMVESEKPRIIPFGLIVMAESAIPRSTDCEKYRDRVNLTKNESSELTKFLQYREENPHCFPDGQISNDLRTAGLKLVSEGIKIRMIEIFEDRTQRSKLKRVVGKDLPRIKVDDVERFRIFTNEPRHLLRSVPPSFSDVIMGSRLGALAVDNAMAGYTDFMISQWLTEFVMVPLDLVALGRKHIPQDGIFWKSVLAKTGQGDLS